MMAEDVVVTPTDSGPYQIRGRIRLVLPSGREIETEEEGWLCRCGGSQQNPFCDGTHATPASTPSKRAWTTRRRLTARELSPTRAT